MKKHIFTVFCLIAAALLGGCSEDKGNYDYTAVDDISIDLPSSSYNVVSGGKLQIKPTLTHSIQANDLSYEWEIDGQKVSTERDLDVQLPAMGYGQKTCAFMVKDNVTGMKFIKTFSIQVVGQINIGYYFLTQDASENSLLAYLPIATDDNPNPEVIQTNACGDVSLGSKPRSIIGAFSSSNIAGYKIWSIILLSNGDENRCILTGGNTFLPIMLLSEGNFVEQSAGYKFNPEACISDRRGNIYFFSNGQCMFYTKGLLYRPAKHDKEYYWTNPIAANTGESFLWVYDQLSHKYYAIRALKNNPELGIVGDSRAYDDVIEIKDSPDLSGQAITYTGWTSTKHFVCTAGQGKIQIHNFTRDYTADTFTYDGGVELSASGIDTDTKTLLVKNMDWFFFAGNKIYTSPVEMPKIADFMTIPDEYGKVTAVSASGRGERLVVATYDENATSEMKGSILLIDVATKKLTAYKHCMYKCVSCLGANETTDPNYGDIGDGM